MSRRNSSAHSDGDLETAIIEWDVPSFENLLKQVGQKNATVNSKDTTAGFGLKIQFPRNKNDIFEVYFISPDAANLKCVLLFMLHDSYEELIKIEKDFPTVQANKWQYLATVDKKQLDIDEGGTITCEFEYHIIREDALNLFNIPKPQIIGDFENLLSTGLYSDFMIKSTEGIEFKVHKAVLASRSAVLNTHLKYNTKDCHTIETAFEADVLREILKFIYSDKAPRVDEMPEKLLEVADFYQLIRLVSMCEKAIHNKLTVENAIDTLKLADKYSLKTLKQLTLQFIKDSPSSIITKTEGWSTLTSSELIKCVCEYVVADDVEQHILIWQK